MKVPYKCTYIYVVCSVHVLYLCRKKQAWVHLHVTIAFAIYEKFQGTSFIDKHIYLLPSECTKIKTFIERLYVRIFFIIFPPESDFCKQTFMRIFIYVDLLGVQ